MYKNFTCRHISILQYQRIHLISEKYDYKGKPAAAVEERCTNVWSRENNEEVETRVYILVGNKLC